MNLNKKTFLLYLQTKEFEIPQNFPNLQNVEKQIFNQLISTNEYKVKSRVSEDVFQSFLNNWTKNELPNIQISNFKEYELLSQEFDRMKNLIQLFKKYISQHNLSSLLIEKQDLPYQMPYNNIEKIYHNTIDILFDNEMIKLEIGFLNFKSEEIMEECENGNVRYIDLITSKKIRQNGIIYALNDKEKIATLFKNFSASKIILPRSITYQSIEYTITTIYNSSFQTDPYIKSVIISKECEIKNIEKSAFSHCKLNDFIISSPVNICYEAFYHSKIDNFEIQTEITIEKNAFKTGFIKNLTIPSNFNNFTDGWCKELHIKNIIITPSEELLISFYNDTYLIGKSDPKSNVFDVILYVRKDIEEAIIPPFIRVIGPYAFNNCYKLQRIVIPPQIISIGKNAFDSCTNLETIEIPNNSILYSIGRKAFKNTLIKELYIPPSVVELYDGWCCDTKKLTNVVISPKNDLFINLNSQFILGKLNSNIDEYDVLIFARRDIKKVVIPSFIKIITSYAFEYCSELNIVEFPSDSKLMKIYKYAFSNSSIRNVSIPSNVNDIDKCAFQCNKLQNIEFSADSELRSIKRDAVSNTFITSIIIPKKVKILEECSLDFSYNLKIIEIEENSDIKAINSYCINNKRVLIMVPPKSKTLDYLYNIQP